MAKKIALALLGVVVLFLIIVAAQPSTYHVERSLEVKAPPDIVFPLIDDLSKFGKWDPWAEMDPAMKTTLSEKTSGVGASLAWEGNKDVGTGKMTITESQAPSRVRFHLELVKPMEGTAEAGFTIAAAGEGASKVTWDMDGANNFAGKAASLFMDMDKMIGDTYNKGLANLDKLAQEEVAAAKAKAEAEAKARAEAEAAAAAAAAAALAAATPEGAAGATGEPAAPGAAE